MTATAPPAPVASVSGCRNPDAYHPLELIPLFRRIPHSIPRNLVYTLIWNTLIALIFTLLNLMFDARETFTGAFPVTFVFANCIGFVIHFEMMLGDLVWPGVQQRGLAARTIYFTLLPLVGVFAGYWLATTLLHFDRMQMWVFSARGALIIGTVTLILSGMLLAIFIPRERAARLQAAYQEERARVAAAERETAQARFRLLEAQVEPHFLYNTLANVVSLVDTDPATAKRMIERLIVLLRGAAAAAGAGNGTLADQIEHLRAYLELMALRMGGRLAFDIDIPADVAALTVPPLLLQPLVENAIRHGLEPKVGGGAIRVTGRRDGDALSLVVADTGVGFAARRAEPAPGSGLGLANVRQRLEALYGRAATLVVEDNEPDGARITLRLPVAPRA
jgi:signal transduction histidine kinase